MKKAVILHGTSGSPDGNWFRWLEEELVRRNIEVWLPLLPSAEQPNLKNWIAFVSQNTPFDIDDETIIFGHSSGATLALALSGEFHAQSVIAVSPFVPMEEKYVATQWEANENLFSGVKIEELLSLTKQDSTNRFVVYSDDDPYIPINVYEHIIEMTAAEGILIPRQGHFNLEKSETYRKFPALLKELIERKLIKK